MKQHYETEDMPDMENLKYNVSHDETLKWRYGKKAFCLHVMHDDAPLSPLESDSIVKLAFFGNKSGLGSDDRTKDISPLDYLVQLCRENVDPAQAVRLITDGKLTGIEIEKLDDGLVTVHDKAYVDTFESVMESAVIDVLADNLSFAHCNELLKDTVHIQPVWAYEHSGLTISTGVRKYPYNDQWDSYQIGYAVVMKSDVLANWPDAEANWHERAANAVKGVVEEYDKYLTGDVWGYQLYELEESACDVRREPDWTETDATWGFLGDDMFASGMAESVGNGFVDAFKANAVTSGKTIINTVTQVLLGAPPKPDEAPAGIHGPAGPDRDDGLRPFTATIQRTGCATVMARSGIDALAVAAGIKTDDVCWEDGWSVTDVRPAEE